MSFRLRRYAYMAVLSVALLGAALPRAEGADVRPEQPDAYQLDELLMSYDRVRLDPAEAAARVRSSGRLTIATSEGELDLRLEPHDVRSANYRAQVTHDGGVVEQLEPGPSVTYRGTVRGLEGAEARFTIADEGVTGLVVTDDVWYYVEPERGFSKSADAASHVVYSSLDVRPGAAQWKCGTSLVGAVGTPLDPAALPAGARQTGPTPVLELATEADFEYYDFFETARAANQEILSIVNQVEGIYKKQLGVTIEVVFQNVWDTRRDPYEAFEGSQLLGQLRDYWNLNNPFIERDIVHMWSGNSYSQVLGIAYVGVACRSRSASYGVSVRLPSGPQKFVVTAHELGHNFGALHPDQLSTPVVACSTTIMNSTADAGIELKFCKYSRNQILSFLGGNSACLTNNYAPAVFAGPDQVAGEGGAVTLFGVGSTDRNGDPLTYRWSQTSGPTVSLTSSTSPTPSFQVPSVSDEETLTFKLTVDDGRGGVGEDTVEVTVLPEPLPGVSVISPAAGAALKVGGKLKLRWAADPGLEGALRIELSRDGGATFEVLFDEVPASPGKKKWKVTGPKTGAVVVRLTSLADPRSQTYVPGAFEIR